MKSKHMIRRAVGGIVLSGGLAASLLAQEKATPVTRSFEQVVSVTATVEAIDYAKREVTLKGPLGNVSTITVGDQVKRLQEIKPGDEVTAKYYIGIAAELRKPTAKEKEAPFLILEDAGRAPNTAAPAAGRVRAVRVVATVEGLDRPTQTVTLKGPMGRYLTVRVADPSVLMKPRLGDTVVVTCAEALAVSVEKVATKSKD
jgi:hypothetical protein